MVTTYSYRPRTLNHSILSLKEENLEIFLFVMPVGKRCAYWI